MHFKRILLFLVIVGFAEAQERQFPYKENFDTVIVPALPAGWSTTTHRSPSGDFTTTSSVPFSDSNAVLSSNSTISQSLISLPLDFSGRQADSISFYERRSGSHNSGMLIEASTDGGISFSIQISDTIKNAGTTAYVLRKFSLPSALSNMPSVKFQWRIIGNGTGTTGTIRLDNIIVTARVQLDVGILSVHTLPQYPHAGDPVEILATIRNEGTLPVRHFTVDFYADRDNDSLPQENELISSQTVDDVLLPNDTVGLKINLTNVSTGQSAVIVTAKLLGDQNPANDISYYRYSVGLSKNSVIINEIMYEPRTGCPEYVELYNRSRENADLLGWKLSDRRDTSGKANEFVISKSSLVIGSEEYVVVAADSSLLRCFPYLNSRQTTILNKPSLSLNNDGDDVVLSDATGMMIDSVHYSPSWHNPDVMDVSGKSLERINPDLPSNDRRNWSTSASPDGGTPGKRNTLFTVAVPGEASVSFSPNPFSPDGDGKEDVTIISYKLTSTVGLIRIRIFDVMGRLIRTLANAEPTGSNGEIIWDGFDDNHNRARMGIYVVLLEALSADGGQVQTVKGVVVVAAKM